MAWWFYGNVGVTPFGLKCSSCGPLKAPSAIGVMVLVAKSRSPALLLASLFWGYFNWTHQEHPAKSKQTGGGPFGGKAMANV